MKRIVSKLLKTRFLDISPLAVISILIFIQKWENSFHFFLGLLLFLVGLTIWLIGLLSLGSSFHGLPEPKSLVQSGIYSKVRHPIYLGSVLFFLGLSISTLDLRIVTFTVLLAIVQLLRRRIEDQKLALKFGEEYLVYKQNTWI